jgi:hypothetical protein
VIYRKYDGSLHWNMTMRLLGEDQYGVWSGAAAPSTMRRGDGAEIIFKYAQIMLFPRDAWWTAAFIDTPAQTEIYCDITTPVRWPSANEVTMIDLDLDVRRRRDGSIELLDADEFAEHQVKYGYPAEVIGEAEQSAQWLQDALADGREPFATSYLSYLAMINGNGAT